MNVDYCIDGLSSAMTLWLQLDLLCGKPAASGINDLPFAGAGRGSFVIYLRWLVGCFFSLAS
ncbi:hypothetical protein, partial [Paraburkholderia caribensis]|uniref:hypothetical protein n=1 Tax=Paraburkholderia caribensis TaxID=75105 RepID=UPI003F56A584